MVHFEHSSRTSRTVAGGVPSTILEHMFDVKRCTRHSRKHFRIWSANFRAILSRYDALSRGCAAVAELADAPALGAGGREAVWVRFPPAAPGSLRGPGNPGRRDDMGGSTVDGNEAPGGSVLAYVDESGTYDHVVRTARTLAREHAARLVLYHSVAPPGDPVRVPAALAADGVARVADALSPADLRRAGRPVLASAVEGARGEGIDAWGWLASDPGIGPLMRFAEHEGAEVVVLPAELGDPEVFERLRGDQLQVALERGTVNVVVVDREGRLVGPG